MNKIIFSKPLLTILSILLAVTSNVFVAQAQVPNDGKIGRDSVVKNRFKQEAQTSFMFDGTIHPVTGNVKCKDLSPFYEEFKIDPPKSGNYSFAGNSVTANVYGGEAGLTYVDYQSNVAFAAVIVKGGNLGANVYSFNSPQTVSSGLTTPNLQDISHISFCYRSGLTTTAASASVSGSVTAENGRGISRSMVTIYNLNTEETRTVVTNQFGRYRFDALPVGDLYVVTINNKKFGLALRTQSFVLNGDEENLDFSATFP